MSWLTDQLNLNDIFYVVQRFYDQARSHPDIGHFFSRIEDLQTRLTLFGQTLDKELEKDLVGV